MVSNQIQCTIEQFGFISLIHEKIDTFELHEVILNEPTNFHILVEKNVYHAEPSVGFQIWEGGGGYL